MNNRVIVVLTNGQRDLSQVIQNHQNHQETSQIILAMPSDMSYKVDELNVSDANKVSEIIKYEPCSNIPAAKNLIIMSTRQLYPQYRFLHIIEDDMIIKSDSYLDDVESLMNFLDVKYWFNSYTNPLNTVIQKKSPRFIINLGEYTTDKIEDIHFNAHESNEHMVFDLSKFDEAPQFDDRLKLLYNIEFIYRSHVENDKRQYLNFYPTIASELTDIERDDVHFEHRVPTEADLNLEDEEAVMKELKVEWIPHTVLDGLIHWVDERMENRKARENGIIT